MGDFTMFLDTANSVLVLLTGLIGLIGTGVSTYFAIKYWFQNIKTKSKQETWNMLMEIADKAMQEVEKTLPAGTDKKDKALSIINTSAQAAGLDINEFITQLDAYIDQTIEFVNKMQNKKN